MALKAGVSWHDGHAGLHKASRSTHWTFTSWREQRAFHTRRCNNSAATMSWRHSPIQELQLQVTSVFLDRTFSTRKYPLWLTACCCGSCFLLSFWGRRFKIASWDSLRKKHELTDVVHIVHVECQPQGCKLSCCGTTAARSRPLVYAGRMRFRVED